MPSKPKANDFRERIIREDNLLNTRTTIFLVTNGLLLAAIGNSKDLIICIIISSLAMMVTIFWMIFSYQNWKIIKNLTISYRSTYKSNFIEDIVQKAMFKPGWRRPTDLISKPLPFIFFISWIALLLINILKIIGIIK